MCAEGMEKHACDSGGSILHNYLRVNGAYNFATTSHFRSRTELEELERVGRERLTGYVVAGEARRVGAGADAARRRVAELAARPVVVAFAVETRTCGGFSQTVDSCPRQLIPDRKQNLSKRAVSLV